MRTIGHRKQRPISFSASASLLREGTLFNESLRGLPSGETTFIPKGVYRFATHDSANRHQLDCLANGMARMARKND